MRRVVLTLCMLSLPWAATAAGEPRYPELRTWVVDVATALRPGEIGELGAIAARLDREGTAQLAVAVVRPEDLGDVSRSEYAVELFRRWKLGHSKQSSDGLLLLFVAGPPGHRGLKVEVGYGLEGPLPDGKVGALMDENAGPHLKSGQIGTAAVALARALAATLETGAGRIDPAPRPWLGTNVAIALALSPGAATLALLLVFVLGYLRKRVPGREVKVLVAAAALACLPAFVGLIAGHARWLIWAVFVTFALAVVDTVLYFDLEESRCPKDGRWLRRRIRWAAFAIDKQCGCGYATVFSFAPGPNRAPSSRGGSAAVPPGDWSAGGGGESGGGGADREY
jgi:uncharacterized membrane protein YgcG